MKELYNDIFISRQKSLQFVVSEHDKQTGSRIGGYAPSYFDDDLIRIDNQSSFEVKSNIVDNENLLIYVSSSYDKSVLAVAEVTFHDEDGKTIASDSSSLVILNHSGQVFTFYLPSLVGEYAGNIDIVLKEEETHQQLDFSTSNISLEESHIITEDMNTNFTIQIFKMQDNYYVFF